jgi:hypothetical protein
MPGLPSRPSPRGPRARVDRLADRVRWLDRYRRVLAVSAAAIVSPLMITEVRDQLAADWPHMQALVVLSLLLGVIVWWLIEVGLVYVTALWETEHFRLARDRGLPRAIVRLARDKIRTVR